MYFVDVLYAIIGILAFLFCLEGYVATDGESKDKWHGNFVIVEENGDVGDL
jgi:uncharacterized protein involved in response to NO